jgi:benzaldehyde dehydrogenase (NAD)
MSFLDPARWQGKIYSGGWRAGSGGTYDAVEPATGQTLASVGAAGADDVHAAAERAVEAQRAWAGRPCCAARATCSSSTRTRSTSG